MAGLQFGKSGVDPGLGGSTQATTNTEKPPEQTTAPSEAEIAESTQTVAEEDLAKTDSASDAEPVFFPPEQTNADVEEYQAKQEAEKSRDVEFFQLVLDGSVLYSCHPAQNLTMGEYRFTNTQMSLSAEEAEKFDALLKTMPPITQMQVKKLDASKVDALIQNVQKSRMVQGMDHSGNTIGPGTEPGTIT